MEKNIFSTFGGLVLFQDVVEMTEELFLVDPPLIPGKGKLKAICSSKVDGIHLPTTIITNNKLTDITK